VLDGDQEGLFKYIPSTSWKLELRRLVSYKSTADHPPSHWIYHTILHCRLSSSPRATYMHIHRDSVGSSSRSGSVETCNSQNLHAESRERLVGSMENDTGRGNECSSVGREDMRGRYAAARSRSLYKFHTYAPLVSTAHQYRALVLLFHPLAYLRSLDLPRCLWRPRLHRGYHGLLRAHHLLSSLDQHQLRR